MPPLPLFSTVPLVALLFIGLAVTRWCRRHPSAAKAVESFFQEEMVDAETFFDRVGRAFLFVANVVSIARAQAQAERAPTTRTREPLVGLGQFEPPAMSLELDRLRASCAGHSPVEMVSEVAKTFGTPTVRDLEPLLTRLLNLHDVELVETEAWIHSMGGRRLCHLHQAETVNQVDVIMSRHREIGSVMAALIQEGLPAFIPKVSGATT